jgi:hypothetical protein
MLNLYNNTTTIKQNQKIYDSFNSFIFSDDRNVFNKLYHRIKFYEMTKHLMGDIIECGVFKGSGIATWLKILKMNEPNSIKKVIGFDFFNPGFVSNINDKTDKEMMQQVFDRCDNIDALLSLDSVTKSLIECGANTEEFELISGDVSVTSKLFAEERVGARISILYLDLDLAVPTYDALNNLWDLIVDGGIVVLDEYAYHKWSESNGVDKFIKEKGLTLHPTYVKAPTAYIIK